MRLLNVRTYKLHSFFDDYPPYVILSHCWEDDEILYSDIIDIEVAKERKGFIKIKRTCERAIEDGFDYCWIDTCCIDKRSSAELSEAINSMFRWYKQSKKCYAYLADVEGPHDFEKSKWFTRAWTLQELLAPQSFYNNIKSRAISGMDFFSRDWKDLGSRTGLSNSISKITGVAKEYLEGKSLNTASISMRMSWAANRRATRSEDIAYSLLGIFDVNMPLLYGEGRLKAFRRLQEEIMKISEDETLFAWDNTESSADGPSADALASDPKDFIEARDLIPFASDEPAAPYTMTHRGLRIWLSIYRLNDPTSEDSLDLRTWARPISSPIMIWSDTEDLVWCPLKCHVAHDYHNFVMISLRPVAGDIYTRDTGTNVALIPMIKLPSLPKIKEIYIRNSSTSSMYSGTQRQFGFLIRSLPAGLTIASVTPKSAWDSRSQILQDAQNSEGRQFWHASLQLSLSGALARPKTGLFLSLGCKMTTRNGQPYGQPDPWCFLDDFVYTSDDANLQLFHRTIALADSQINITFPKDCDGSQYAFQLGVKISTERICGQHMFVVDIHREGKFELGDLSGTKARDRLHRPSSATRTQAPAGEKSVVSVADKQAAQAQGERHITDTLP